MLQIDDVMHPSGHSEITQWRTVSASCGQFADEANFAAQNVSHQFDVQYLHDKQHVEICVAGYHRCAHHRLAQQIDDVMDGIVQRHAWPVQRTK